MNPDTTLRGNARMKRILALALIALGSCISRKGSSDPEDPSAAIFEPSHIVEVSVTMAPADWDTLRLQGRSLADIFGGPCLAGPFPSPFTYFPSTVTIDGETLTDVAIRKKGFLGSLDEIRPSLKLKFDEYAPGRDFHGLNRLTLNNCKQDPAYIRQALAYQAFTRAGIPSPRCNFAHVVVNGTDFGIFANVESVDHKFLRRRYYDDRGNLYAGTLSDFRAQWVNTFDKKTNSDDPDRSDLDAVVAALDAPDATVLDALAPVLDVDQFITYWATEILIGHWDGYANNTNNFFVYHDPSSGRFQFLPWGVDGVMNVNQPIPSATQPISVYAKSALARRLYLLPSTQARYLDTLRGLLDTAWNETAILAEIDRMQALITPIADPTGTKGLAAQIDTVRAFVNTRRSDILGELAGGTPAWTQPLSDPPCFDFLGAITGTFTTTYGTLGAINPFATGTGTIVNGTVVYTGVGATCGPNTDPLNPGTMVQVLGLRSDGTIDIVVILVNSSLAVAGATVPLDWGAGFAGIWNFNPTTLATTMTGFIFNGSVHFDQAGAVNGAPVSGSFQGDILKLGP